MSGLSLMQQRARAAANGANIFAAPPYLRALTTARHVEQQRQALRLRAAAEGPLRVWRKARGPALGMAFSVIDYIRVRTEASPAICVRPELITAALSVRPKDEPAICVRPKDDTSSALSVWVKDI